MPGERGTGGIPGPKGDRVSEQISLEVSLEVVQIDFYFNIMTYFMNENLHLIKKMSGRLLVSCVINMHPSPLSYRVTTDRKDLRVLLERTVLE